MSLKTEIESPHSPLRQVMAVLNLRPAMADIRAQLAGADVIDVPAEAGRDVVGHAVSEALVWGIAGSWRFAGGRIPQGRGLTDLCEALADAPTADADRNARLSWLAGLLDRLNRPGADLSHPEFAPFEVLDDLEAAIAAVPAGGAALVTQLVERCEGVTAQLRKRQPRLQAPTFAGSVAVGGGDGDLICAQSLIEFKAVAEPSTKHLRQLIGYTLIDWDNQYALDQVALLYVRHGRLITWRVDELFPLMGGHQVTLQSLRDATRKAYA